MRSDSGSSDGSLFSKSNNKDCTETSAHYQESGPRKRKSNESFQETTIKKQRSDFASDSSQFQMEPGNSEITGERDSSPENGNSVIYYSSLCHYKSGKGNEHGVVGLDQYEESNKQKSIHQIHQLVGRLNLLGKYQSKIKSHAFLQVFESSLQRHEPCGESNLVQTYIQRLLITDYRARYIPVKEKPREVFNTQRTMVLDTGKTNAFEKIFKRSPFEQANEASRSQPIHPMDIQMIVYLYADNFLRQLMVTKLSQCQYALPLLVPNPFTQEIEFPMWTLRQIKKSWKSHKRNISKNQTVYKTETPMVAFFRFSEVSASKSELMNSLINERHTTFFHRHCSGSTRSNLLMDGVVEIAWYCPSGDKNDKFTDCVAFCNLHGDAQANESQLKILTEESSINVVLLPNHDKSDKSMAIVEKLYSSKKPLICLLTEDDSGVSKIQEGKYKIGLKQRNKSDISEDVRRAIKDCLSKPLSVFKLTNMGKHTGLKVDEDDEDCKGGKKTAEWMIKLLERKELCKIKETFLPCQGKLWHDWCLKNKELHRPQGDNIEMYNSQKQKEMHKIREQQVASGISNFMNFFIEKINSQNFDEKIYFLKWLGIFLDEYTSEDLSMLHHKYDEKWSKVLDLKKKHDKSEYFTAEQSQLEMLSEKLNAATFGLEHILREIGQIYESDVSVNKNAGSRCKLDVRSLPRIVAELMISGYPLELMDGDAAHVPLIWVKAVLNEIIKILGDQRVFVLSVLGIQSTGKSTMLNAMFGLQFAVSAGRCTRGAFMQLIKVSEELRKQSNFDYILVVDTEGLRALELAGRSTRNHDNEMATFVVGLGNMTLINIFGENPAEMQDILQIVVQAFLRMRKVRLNPSCMFVHQNVGDITAGEKNMVGKRRLQEKLDEMTQLAAKEEVCDAECFSDVIKFDVKTDVRYFAQLWEGSPPMAPPNPCYSENVQELKSAILSHASKSKGVTLAQFRDRIGDLWNALLNENFVFSFKNTLEIVTYRKLEEEYANWTWSLRSAMLEIEDKLHNRINNRKLHKIESRELEEAMAKTLEEVKSSMKHYFNEHKEKEMLIQWKLKFEEKIKHMYGELVRDAKTKLENILSQREALTKLVKEKTLRERRLLEKSKELAFSHKHEALDENELRRLFDSVWEKWVSELMADVPPFKEINIAHDKITILNEMYEEALVRDRLDKFENIVHLPDLTIYVNPIKKANWNSINSQLLPTEEQESIKQLMHNVIRQTENMVKSKSVAKIGYHLTYLQEIAKVVKYTVGGHKCMHANYEFKKEFIVDLTLYACLQAGRRFGELYQVFRATNDPWVYLERKKPEYYRVFQGFCKGATSAAVFGALICRELKEPILQSVYNKTANDLAGEMRTNISAFKGNRSNLEKHILKALAEEEEFYKFMEYIHHPKNHFEDFIQREVRAYITEGNPSTLAMIKGNIRHKEQCVITAAERATAEVLSTAGDANMWLDIFSGSLKDELEYNKEHLTGDCCQDITDFELLEEVVKRELRPIIDELNRHLTNVSDIEMTISWKPPGEILIDHFCQCCWVQCPFCKVVCVNTMEDHPGDHIAPFHRNCGMRGMIYRGTTNLCLDFCTSSVASDTHYFFPNLNSDETVLWKEYRTAGPEYANWSITPDLSELPYWKWFVCRFQTDLEEYYSKTFNGSGTIPIEWRSYTKEQALESLEKYL